MTEASQPRGARRTVLPVAALLAAGLGAAAWFSLAGDDAPATAAHAARSPGTAPARLVLSEAGHPAVRLDAAAQARGGIETAALAPATWRDEVRAHGTVLELTRLTELTNNHATATAAVQTARARLDAARTAFERARTLNRDHGNVSAAQFQAAEATFRTEQAALAAAESGLRTLAATARQEWGPVLGVALIEEAPAVTRLIERQEMLVQVTLPLGFALDTPPAEATVSVPGRGARATLRYVSPATRTDPRLQGQSLLYAAPGDAGLLPGMNVVAFLPSDRIAEGRVVPEEAVVRWQGKAWVYLPADAQTFERREIATDLPAPRERGGGYVVRGLPAGARVVTRGAQLLLSEELRSQFQGGAGDES